MFESATAVPVVSTVPLVNVKFVTVVPLTPLPPVFLIVTALNDGLSVLVSDTPWLVVFWIVPPLTVRLPEAPVLFRMMPLDGPEAVVPADAVANFKPPAPIVVFVTFSAMPVVVASVLVELVDEMVPPP